MNPVGPRVFKRDPWVRIATRPEHGEVEVVLSELGARRLMLALGVNTDRYGPEVKALLDGLAKVLLGTPAAGFEQSSPHGSRCSCPHCRGVWRSEPTSPQS